jgi:hypothetical protein
MTKRWVVGVRRDHIYEVTAPTLEDAKRAAMEQDWQYVELEEVFYEDIIPHQCYEIDENGDMVEE